jgi:hypothetical protein
MSTYRIAVRFIPLGSTDGTIVASIDEAWCKTRLADINPVYVPSNIQFVFGSLQAPVLDDRLNFDTLWYDADKVEVPRKEYAEKFPSELVVFVRRYFSGDSRYAAFNYSSVLCDYVVAEPGSENWSVAHEFGHFFGLPHTFNDDLTVDLQNMVKDVPGRITHLSGLLNKAIAGGMTKDEALNTLDADRGVFTDTPPDVSPLPFQPNDTVEEANSSSSQTSVTIPVKITKGFLISTTHVVLAPDKLNVMSYFNFNERPHLSPQQANFVQNLVYAGKRRRLIRGRWTNWISCNEGVLKGSPSVIRRQPELTGLFADVVDKVVDVVGVVSQQSGLMELFGRGTDDRTWQNSFVNGNWTGWFPHNDGFTLGSTPTVGSMNSGHLMLVACAANGVVHSKYWLDSAGKWTNWEPLGAATLKDSPSIICRNSKLVELFGRGMDDRTWQNSFTNGKWTGWFPHNDGFTLSSTPSVGSMNSAHLMLVACATGGGVHSKYWLDSEGKWTNWEPLGAATLKGSPSIISRNQQLVELFGRGIDDRTWQNTFVNGKWLGWFSHNDDFAIATTPTVGSLSPDHLQLFVTDPNGKAKQKWWFD